MTGRRRWHSSSRVVVVAPPWYCVHTANTETVNYLSSRSDIASTLGIVGSFVVYMYLPRSRRWHWYVIPMLIGVLAKPSAVIFAPLLVAYVLLFEEEVSFSDVLQPEAGSKIWGVVLRTAPALLLGVLAFLLVEGMAAEAQDYGNADRVPYLRTQAWVWLHYLKLFLVPVGLTADTDWDLITTWTDTRVVAGLATVGLLGWAAIKASTSRAWRPVAFGLCWFAAGLLPASSIFPLAEVANEHRVYLPFAGLTLAASWAVLRVARSRSRMPGIPTGWAVAGGILLLAHSVGTFVRNGVWLDEETLWADVIEKSPDNGRAWMNYGLVQMKRGRYAIAHADFRRASELWPNYPPVHVNLGIATHRLGDTVQADSHFQRAIELDPGYGPGRYFYGRYLVESGRAPEAIESLRTAVDLQPSYAPPKHLLLRLYYLIGSQVEVRSLADLTLAIDPGDSYARSFLDGDPVLAGVGASPFERGLSLTAVDRHLDAGVAYKRQLAVLPNNADAYLNLGWSYMQLGFDPLALMALQEVLRLRPDDQLAINNLRSVQRRMGVPIS